MLEENVNTTVLYRLRRGWNSQHKRIYLSMKIFEAWRDAKTDAGYSLSSDSDFAAHLLSLEYRRR